ncbi:histamine N-methyltransferase-like isoform X2 [Neoarius graeffei]|uniref:histamine N-methyltransferase-like isoform X2 n=1 Tax=Neoarius graeffei TaxID=443677 RepID=UPI00298BFA85|nr:histamine N-methyltransferase-like isoform X2 [Neoarius graeffei]
MAVQIRRLGDDYSRYQKAFELFLECSSEHQSMRDFIHSTLPDILTTVGAGKSTLNMMGVGSGSGLVSRTPGLDHITFKFNNVTATEFESDWKQRNTDRKMDFIHMIQMLYYVKDPEATVSFFRSLLHKDGKLLVILVSGQSGWHKLLKTYQAQLYKSDVHLFLTMGDIRNFLDAKGIPYQSHTLPSQLDITECFTAGDEKGELLLDFLTQVVEFSKSASPELKAGVLELLKRPDCSCKVDGRIMFNSNIEALVLTP